MNMHSTTNAEASSMMQSAPVKARGLFDVKVDAWIRSNVPDRFDDAAMRKWETLEDENERIDAARDIIHFPVPFGHLCCLRSKIDVLVTYASTVGENMTSHERIVLEGLCALRADIVHMGG